MSEMERKPCEVAGCWGLNAPGSVYCHDHESAAAREVVEFRFTDDLKRDPLQSFILGCIEDVVNGTPAANGVGEIVNELDHADEDEYDTRADDNSTYRAIQEGRL